MGFSKKHGKNRLDKYYHMAKEQGFRARSAFKLVQLNKKYGFLEKSKCVIDLCAAPGGWCQVASKYMPTPSLVIGVDLVPIKPIPNVITMVQDITTNECRAALRAEMKHFKADVVLHDGAPNVGKSWVHDAFSQNELTLSALKLATEFLIPNGVFVTKVFRSKDYNKLLWVFHQLFEKAEATKPAASRDVSAEIFVICSGFKAPKAIDPRLLDPKFVFKDVEVEELNEKRKREDQSKLLNSLFAANRQRRFRDGYEDGNYTLHKSESVYRFLTTNEPVSMLADCSQIKPHALVKEASAEAASERAMSDKVWEDPLTSAEIKEYLGDLKVLGKREMKELLKWREAMRKQYLSTAKKDSEAEGDEDKVIPQEVDVVDELLEKSSRAEVLLKREKRKKREKRAKELERMRLGMEAPLDIGLEASANVDLLTHHTAEGSEDSYSSDGEDGDKESDMEYYNRLESQADKFYDNVVKRNDAKKKPVYEEWDGFDREAESAGTDSESEDVLESGSELEEIGVEDNVKLSRKAETLFKNPIFANCDTAKEEEAQSDCSSSNESDGSLYDAMETAAGLPSEEEQEKDTFEFVKPTEYDPAKDKYAITTAELYTLAQKAVSKNGMQQLISDGFNKRTYNDPMGLPDWFLEDERRHNKINKPISKEAAEHIKQQMQAINARPIKKIAEAKGRKKMRALRRIQSLQKKMGQVIDDDDIGGASKTTEMRKLLEKAKRVSGKKKDSVQVVVAKGHNRGVKGRPKGVKGRYKMVDPRGKKELRAEKRKAKREKSRRR